MTTEKQYPPLIRYGSLAILVAQITTMVILLRISRTSEGPMYISSTAILLSELFKLFSSLYLFSRETTKQDFFSELKQQTFGRGIDSMKILIPTCLYVVQNNLLFYAMSHLDAATYQITYQLKVLTTACFSVWILGKKIDGIKWLSLMLLMVGVSFVQIDTINPDDSANPESSNRKIGVFALLLACVISGLAGVYLEKIVKTSPTSVWVRNIQMSLFSLVPCLFTVLWTDPHTVIAKGFFYGYTPLVWLVVILQGSSGIIVATVIKYADNILKGFATSISIIFSSLLSVWIFDFHPTSLWLFGTVIVISSAGLYALPSGAISGLQTQILPTKKEVNL